MRHLIKRPWWLTVGLILAVLLGSVAAISALLLTEGGLRLALGVAQRFAPGELTWEQASGRLVGPVQVSGLTYVDGAANYSIRSLDLEWSPGRLLARRLSIHRLHVDGVVIQLPTSTEDDSGPIEPGWQLPLEVVLRDVALRGFSLQSGAAAPFEVQELRIAASSGLDWVDIETFQLRLTQEQVRVRGRLGLGRDIATDLQLQLEAAPAGVAPLKTTGRLTGTWTAFVLEQQLTQPVAATARLELADPFGALRWALDMDVPVTSLDRFAADLPALQLGGRVQGSGALQEAELKADLRTDWEAAELYPVQIELSLAEGDDGSLRLQPLVAHSGEARLRLSGGWHPDAEEFNLLLDGKTLQWPLQGVAAVEIPQAEVRVAGRLDDYQLQLQGDVAGNDFPPTSVQGRGRGSATGMRIEQLALTTLEGIIDVVGQFDWSPQLHWDATLTARDINPGQHWPAWPGKLTARLHSSGSGSAAGVDLQAQIETLSGTLRDYPVAGQGRIEYQAERLTVQDIALSSGTAQLTLNGAVDQRWALQWQVNAADLGQVLPDLAGSVMAQGTVDGPRAAPHLQGRAQLAEFRQGDIRLAQFDVDADLSLAPGAPLALHGKGRELFIGARRFDALAVDLDGKLEQHRLQIEANGPSHALSLQARGGWDGELWNGRIERSGWQLPETGAWTQRAAVAARFGSAGYNSEPLCWQQQTAELCLRLNATTAEQRIAIQLKDWPLAERAPLFLPPETQLAAAALSFDLQAQQLKDVRQTLAAQFNAQVSAGELSWQEGTRRESTRFGGIDAQAQLTNSGVTGTAVLRLTGQDRLDLSAQLPGYKPGVAAARQPLTGQLKGEVRDFALLEGLLGNVDQLQGVLRADARLQGSLAEPRLAGELRLDEGRAFIGPAGITLEDLQLVLSGDPASGQLRLQGAARSGPGTVALDGTFSEPGSAAMQGRLHITGAGFEAVNLPEARVLLTPDIRLEVQPQTLLIEGSLTIPEARIEPRDASGAQTPSKDVVLLNQAEEPPPAWAVTSRIKMILGDKVHFNGFGLTSRLTGALDVTDEPERVTLASGELKIVDGEYKAYGQALKIASGRILYRGGPIDNPTLDIRATRKTGDVLAGVKVYGDLQQPEMELFSQPSLPQADQLSYLLLGRPVQGASGSEGQLLFQAASSLGLKGGNALAQNIGNTFGLDEVSVGGNGDDLDSAALVIGKYLSPRLYLNYSVGLLDAVNKLQLRYQLSRRWSLQTETGTATGGDILYSYER